MAGIAKGRSLVASVALVVALMPGLFLFGMPGNRVNGAGSGQSSQDVSFSVQGKISELSPGKITVDSGNNMNFEVRYDAKTDIQHSDGTPAKASELQIGLEIRAEGALAESGDVFARKIILKPGSKDPSN